jgi:hypothetical protein
MTLLAHSFDVSHSDIVFERFDGDLVVLNLRTGQYFGFNPAGAAIWAELAAGAPAQRIVEAGVPPGDVERFVGRLVELDLLVAAAPKAVEPDAALAGKLAGAAPEVESFDDLAELMKADPIHDVDAEFGWPHRPADA